MKCPSCSAQETKVIDSRSSLDSTSIRRRRQCPHCQKRFTTREAIEVHYPRVVKRSGLRCVFNEEKIQQGIVRAMEKRPIDSEQIESLVQQVKERVVLEAEAEEISSQRIGDIVMEALRRLDEVAYVRFASVYKSFASVESFVTTVQNLKLVKEESYD